MALWITPQAQDVSRFHSLTRAFIDIGNLGGSIIAGNHDLTLHEDWYADEYDRWHWASGKQVCYTPHPTYIGS